MVASDERVAELKCEIVCGFEWRLAVKHRAVLMRP